MLSDGCDVEYRGLGFDLAIVVSRAAHHERLQKQNGKTPVARGQLIRCARNESVATRSIAMGQSTQ